MPTGNLLFGKFSRRAFGAAAVAVPAVVAQQTTSPNGQVPPANRPEDQPFSGPLEFTRRPVTLKARPFALTDVRLLPGPFQLASDWNRAYMSRLPADRLMHTFRLNAGLPAADPALGGWEAPKSEVRGHFIGHYLSACALRFVSSGDGELKAKADEMVADMARCQEKLGGSGYLSAFPVEFFDRLQRLQKVWAPFYTIHKVMAGLLDMNQLAGNRQALEVVTRMAEWTDRWTGAHPEPHMQEILKNEYGGMGEVLYGLSAVTQEDRWARVGDRFTKKSFVTPLALRKDQLRGLHANTHIPQVIAAARRYELSSDFRFHDVADFFFDTVAKGRTYATGGTSNREHWITEPRRLALEMPASANHQECCCAYNMMKLTRKLYSWTADPRYFDYYERNLFNHRLGAIQPETGHSIYFLSMTPGAWKTLITEDRTFWCCTGTAVEEFAKLNDSIYYHDDLGLFVNLFVASELNWKAKGIGLRQDTDFPNQPATKLTVTATPASPWTMRIRIPAWCDSASAKVNGKPVEAMATPGSYLQIVRTWKKGDHVEVSLPMRLTSEPTPDDPRLQAFLYGPIVLAGRLGKERLTEELIRDHQGPEVAKAPMQVPQLIARGDDPAQWIKPAGSAPLEFHTTGQSKDIALSPLNRLWERFAVYWPMG